MPQSHLYSILGNERSLFKGTSGKITSAGNTNTASGSTL